MDIVIGRLCAYLLSCINYCSYVMAALSGGENVRRYTDASWKPVAVMLRHESYVCGQGIKPRLLWGQQFSSLVCHTGRRPWNLVEIEIFSFTMLVGIGLVCL